MPWPHRRTRFSKVRLQREVDGLKTTIVCLRRELESKQGAVQRLEVLLCERLTKVDQLVAQVDQLRHQNKMLDAEAEHYAALLTQKLDTVELANRAGDG